MSSDQNTQASMLMRATQGLIELLSPLDSQSRKRAVQAAFVLLGETPVTPKEAVDSGEAGEENGNKLPVSAKAKLWMRQNEISENALAQVFHFEDGTASFIAGEMPGKSGKEKSLNAYVLSGLASFLVSGESKFEDKQARKLCTNVGCYDSNNHGAYLKAKGNSFTGSKDKGWTLTAPGLKTAAKLVHDLTAAEK